MPNTFFTLFPTGLFNYVGSQSYMDTSLWDFSAVAANRDAVRAKAGNGRGVVDRVAQVGGWGCKRALTTIENP